MWVPRKTGPTVSEACKGGAGGRRESDGKAVAAAASRSLAASFQVGVEVANGTQAGARVMANADGSSDGDVYGCHAS